MSGDIISPVIPMSDSNHTTGRSSKRRQAGAAVERKICQEYGLEPDHSRHADAKYPSSGTPVEIKGALRRKSDGRGGTKEGEFFIYEHRHRWLRRNNGYYTFAVYRFRGRGIQILDTKRLHAGNLPYFSFHESGHPGRQNAREARFKVSDIFG